MTAFVLLLGAMVAQAGSYAEAMEALGLGRYGDAWAHLTEEADPLSRHRGRAEVLYRAGDAGGALRELEAGLELAPDDLELLFRAGSTAYWLGDAATTERYTRRLREAVMAADLSAENHAGWEEAVSTFEGRSRELQRVESDREATVARARIVSVLLLVAAAAFLVFLGRPVDGQAPAEGPVHG